MAEFVESSDQPTKNQVRQTVKLEKCPDQNATVTFTIGSVLVSANASGTETVSMASGAMSVDSGPESEFDFGDLESGTGPSRGRRARPSSNLNGENVLVQL